MNRIYTSFCAILLEKTHMLPTAPSQNPILLIFSDNNLLVPPHNPVVVMPLSAFG